jgi:hypothetical protein
MVKSGAEWPDSAHYCGSSFCCQCALASGAALPGLPAHAGGGKAGRERLAVSRDALRHSPFYTNRWWPGRAGRHTVNPFSGLLG